MWPLLHVVVDSTHSKFVPRRRFAACSDTRRNLWPSVLNRSAFCWIVSNHRPKEYFTWFVNSKKVPLGDGAWIFFHPYWFDQSMKSFVTGRVQKLGIRQTVLKLLPTYLQWYLVLHIRSQLITCETLIWTALESTFNYSVSSKYIK